MYDRGSADDFREIDRWDHGVGWLAHPHEESRRASHAIRDPADGSVWLVDPLDADGVDELVATLGDVAGVVVLSGYHARDAGTFARRYGCPVHVPSWIDRVASRIDAPTERFAGEFAGFSTRRLEPLNAWREAVAYRESDRTLYVPDFLTALPDYRVGDEQVAMNAFARLSPPRETFADLEPRRILFGHGPGVFDDADGALDGAFADARRRFPRALVQNGFSELRAMLGALR